MNRHTATKHLECRRDRLIRDLWRKKSRDLEAIRVLHPGCDYHQWGYRKVKELLAVYGVKH